MGIHAPEELSEPTPLIETYSIEMDDFEKNVIRSCGFFFLIVSVVFACLGATGVYPYYRMRELPVEVIRGLLLIDVNPQLDQRPDWPIYTLRLDLRATDGSGRLMHVESELPSAVYPEEAFDELDLWRTGTEHTVQLLRSNAAEVRLPGSFDREMNSAAVMFTLGLLGGILTLVFFPVMTGKMDHWMRWPMILWRVLAITMFVCICPIWLVSGVPMHSNCCNFHVNAVLQGTKIAGAPPAIPENVQVTEAAMKRLSQWKYSVVKYRWEYRVVHGGLGDQDGVHDGLGSKCPAEPVCEFMIYGQNRWNVDRVTRADDRYR